MAITFFFGVRPKNYVFFNQVTHVTDPDGIRFAEYGIAYTEPLRLPENLLKNSFSLEISFLPSDFNERNFECLLMFHAENDDNQLLAAQWHSWLIVMNGDDYDHRRRAPRIAANIARTSRNVRFLTITSDKKGTNIYLDGRIAKTIKGLRLVVPNDPDTRLILGNSSHGKKSWQGAIYGLALFDHRLNNNQIKTHFRSWQGKRSFLFAEKDRPVILYLFEKKASRKVVDHGTAGADLKIPSMMHIIDKKFLVADWDKRQIDSGFLLDATVNLLGFVPLGFVLIFTFSRQDFGLRKHAVWITLVSCFLVSLIMEVLQAWLPSRSSDVFDLFFNTFGAATGIVLFLQTRHKMP